MSVTKNKLNVPFLFTAAAVLLTIVMVGIFSGGKRATREQVVASEPAFGPSNYCTMKKDTFASLVRRAYGGLAVVSQQNDLLYVDIKDANQLAGDFFNGNDSLLQYRLGDFGFEITYSPEDRSVHAAFRISGAQGIRVPNDVLIKLMDKRYD